MNIKLSNSFSKLILIVLGLFIITSCGERKSIKKVEELTKKFYAIAQAEHLDSLSLLYPDIDLELFKNIYPDGEVYIDEVKPLGNNKYKVEVYPNTNLYFEKNDSSTFGYIITDSEGFVMSWRLPNIMEACGSIKELKKYTDMEYLERYKIANVILTNKCQEVADYVNQNVEILMNTTRIMGTSLPLTKDDNVIFTLVNHSNVACLGFKVTFNLAEFMESNTDLGEISGYWDSEMARLQPGGRANYSVSFNSNDLKIKNSWNKRVTSAKFEITPGSIWKYCSNYVNFTGKEYEEYIEKNAIVDEIEDNSDSEVSE